MSVNGLEKITDKILSDANSRAEAILSEGRAAADAVTSAAHAKADALRDAQAKAAEEEGREILARAKAEAASYRRDLLLATQRELVDSVFESTYAEVKALPAEQYRSLLTGLLTAALTEAADGKLAAAKYELLLNQADRDRYGNAVIEETRKRSAGKLPAEILSRLTLGEKPINIDGGLVLSMGDIETNCSLRTLFGILKEELEGEVSVALFEEKGR